MLPEPPDPSSGEQYAQLVKGLKVHCLWCKRKRCLSVFGAFMDVEVESSLAYGGLRFALHGDFLLVVSQSLFLLVLY